MSVMNTVKKTVRKITKKLEKPRCQWPLERLIESDMEAYEKTFGKRFDIRHPRTFTEKIQWYKFFYRNDDLKRIVDKCEFKEYIRQELGEGYTIPMLGVYSSMAELEKAWPALPKEFCLKSTVSGNGHNMLIIRDKDAFDFAAHRGMIKSWFDPRNTLLNSNGTGYHQCVPRILAEEYMETISGQLFDYKFFCFSGKPAAIYAASEHFKNSDHHNGYPIAFYDLDWNKMDVRYGQHRNDDIPPPKHLKEMIELSAKLSKKFPFVRVDFFDTDDKLYLAEMTFYPGGGFTHYQPEEFNEWLGDQFVIDDRAE